MLHTHTLTADLLLLTLYSSGANREREVEWKKERKVTLATMAIDRRSKRA